MCVLSSKLLFGGTDWIENWRRGDKHKLGFSPKKNKNIGHYRISLSLQCVGELHVVMITISESFILYLRNTPFLFSAKFPIVLPSWPWSRNTQASEESLNDKKHIQNDSAITDLLCLLFWFSNTDEMKSFEWWKVLKVHSLLSILSSWLAGCLFGQATILWHFLMKIFFVLS